MASYEQCIRESVFRKDEIDTFLSSDELTKWGFDPELGYTLGDYITREGIDESLTITTTTPNEARRPLLYADRPCRINTYGNSFTECAQVSDHETWQEYLAAHLGEPIRNFGVGGYGFYQAYRRMIRTEATDDAADYVVLYIWGDDHFRSLLRCRHILCMGSHRRHRESGMGDRMVQGNFWSNLEMDLDSGEFVERPSVLSTPESLYRMTDADFMVEALRDDLMLQMTLLCRGEAQDIDRQMVNRLAERLGCERLVEGSSDRLKSQVSEISTAYAIAATRYIIERSEEFAADSGKKLLIILFCPRVTRELITTGKRYDQPIVDYLRERQSRYFDTNLAHVEDFKSFNISLDEYMSRYLIGHYSPKGNHFFAFAIKDEIIDWLDPKPITYRDDNQALVGFREGYLP
jgi:hypothetical protein